MEAIKEIHYTQMIVMVKESHDIKVINKVTTIMLQMNEEQIGHLAMNDFLKRLLKD